MRRSISLAFALLIAPAAIARADYPKDWGGGGENYELRIDPDVKHGGKSSGSIASTVDDATFGSLTQAFKAEKYRGKRMRLRGWIKTADIAGSAGLWSRIDGKEKTALAFDNMEGRRAKGTTDWTRYDVVLDIPDDAEEIYIGFLLAGKGRAWIDDMTVEIVEKDVELTALPTEPNDRMGPLDKDLPEGPRNLDFER